MAESMNGQTHMNHLWIDLLTMFVGSRQKHFSYKLSPLQNGCHSLVWKSSTGSDLSSVQHLRDEPDRWLWVRPDGDHHVNMWRKDWTLQWSLKLTGCGVLLSVCFYYPESPAGTFKQGVPERDRQRERHRCEQTNLLILLQSNSAASQQTGFKQEAQMFLPWTTREIWQSVRGQFTRWKLLSGAWSHKSSTSWMENDP